jgi:hypothetical protein
MQWVAGDPIRSIAEKHGVTPRSIHLSIARTMARLHRTQRNQALQLRYDNKHAWRVQDAALDLLSIVMNPTNLFREVRQMMRGARASRSRKR